MRRLDGLLTVGRRVPAATDAAALKAKSECVYVFYTYEHAVARAGVRKTGAALVVEDRPVAPPVGLPVGHIRGWVVNSKVRPVLPTERAIAGCYSCRRWLSRLNEFALTDNRVWKRQSVVRSNSTKDLARLSLEVVSPGWSCEQKCYCQGACDYGR